jgi:hypothetical protein
MLRRCCIAAWNSSFLSSRAEGVGSAGSHSADAWHAQLRRPANMCLPGAAAASHEARRAAQRWAAMRTAFAQPLLKAQDSAVKHTCFTGLGASALRPPVQVGACPISPHAFTTPCHAPNKPTHCHAKNPFSRVYDFLSFFLNSM